MMLAIIGFARESTKERGLSCTTVKGLFRDWNAVIVRVDTISR
jgi:hypothetical protein